MMYVTMIESALRRRWWKMWNRWVAWREWRGRRPDGGTLNPRYAQWVADSPRRQRQVIRRHAKAMKASQVTSRGRWG